MKTGLQPEKQNVEKEDADIEEASRAAPAEPEEPAIAEIANLTQLNAENLTRKIIEHRYSESLLKEETKD